MLRPENCWYALVLVFKDGNTTRSHSWGQPLSLPEEALKPPRYKSCGYQKMQGSSDTHTHRPVPRLQLAGAAHCAEGCILALPTSGKTTTPLSSTPTATARAGAKQLLFWPLGASIHLSREGDTSWY